MANLTCFDCPEPITGRAYKGYCAIRCNTHAIQHVKDMRIRENRIRIPKLVDELDEVGTDEFCRRRYTREDIPIKLLQALAGARASEEFTMAKGYRRPPKDRKVWTPRRIEVIQLVAMGLTDEEIGQRLFVTENTVKTHVKQILLANQARNRAHAVHIAHVRGIL